jgi:hypothetical protein
MTTITLVENEGKYSIFFGDTEFEITNFAPLSIGYMVKFIIDKFKSTKS